jgi:hypothetical protein
MSSASGADDWGDAQRDLEKAAEEMRDCEAALRDAYRSGDRLAIDVARVALQAAIAWYLKAEAEAYGAETMGGGEPNPRR